MRNGVRRLIVCNKMCYRLLNNWYFCVFFFSSVLHGKCIYNMFLWIYTKYANCYFISSMVEIGTVNSEGESVYCMENGIYGSY